MEHDAIEFARCRDDTTLHTYGQSFDEIIEKLEIDCLEITMSKIPAGNYMFKVNNKDTRTTAGIALVSLLLTLNIFHPLF